jgi:hypothetical protein
MASDQDQPGDEVSLGSGRKFKSTGYSSQALLAAGLLLSSNE